MKKLNYLGLLLLVVVLISSCEKDLICKKGSGATLVKTLTVADFNSFDLQEAAEVIVQQGPVQEVIAEGHENVIDKISTSVNNGHWEIEFLENCFKDYELIIYITVPTLDQVSISGSGNVEVEDFNGSGEFKSIISGSGKIDLHSLMGYQSLDVVLSGSGLCRAVDSFQISATDIIISGSGSAQLFQVEADDCKVNMSGAGNAKVFANTSLDISISGSGNVGYKGFPVLNTDISGSGTIVNEN